MRGGLIVVLSVFLLTVSSIVSAQSSDDVSYGPNWETSCDGGSCLTTLYSYEKYFLNESDEWEEISESFDSVNCDINYDYCVDRNLYQVHAKEFPNTAETIKYVREGSTFKFQPFTLNYRNANNQLQQLSTIQEVPILVSDNQISYEDAFVLGTDLNYLYLPRMFKQELVIEDSSTLPEPEEYITSGEDVTLDVDFQIALDNDIDIWINGEIWNQPPYQDVITSNEVLFKKDGEVVFVLPKPVAYDSGDAITELKYEFKKQGNDLYVIMKTPYSWLTSDVVYPVYVDPTVILNYTDEIWDGYVKNDSGTYTRVDGVGCSGICTATSSLCTPTPSLCTLTPSLRVGFDSSTKEFRGGIHWNTSLIPDNVEITDLNLSVYIDDVTCIFCASPINMRTRNMEGDDSTYPNNQLGNEQFFDDMGNGTVYNSHAFGPGFSGNVNLSMSSQGRLDFEDALVDDEFSFGFSGSTSENIRIDIASGVNSNASRRPKLFITYDLLTEVSTPEDLDNVRNDLDGGYFQTGDIDLGGDDFDPIGNSSFPFTGIYKGNGHSITGFAHSDASKDNVGLFGVVSGDSRLRNIFLENQVVEGDDVVGCLVGLLKGNSIITDSFVRCDVRGDTIVGGLVGAIIEDSSVINSHSSGSVGGGAVVGGFVGGMAHGTTIRDSSTTANVFGYNNINGAFILGGFVGRFGISGAPTIETSHASGSVVGGKESLGGFVGLSANSGGTIIDSYATGDVVGLFGFGGVGGIGGFAGRLFNIPNDLTIENSYSVGSVIGETNVGGFIGSVDASNIIFLNSHWDTDTSGQANGCGSGDCTGVEGNTTVNMQQQATYTGWDFANIWGICEGNSYPFLNSVEGVIHMVSTPEGLDNIRNGLDENYIQICDIDLAGFALAPIGTFVSPFTGTYSGDIYSINNFTYANFTQSEVGLFGAIKNALILNVKLGNVDVQGVNTVGGLVGLGTNSSIINSHVLSGFVQGENGIGGLVGRLKDKSITDSSSSARVGGLDAIGGLVGRLEITSTVNNSQVFGNVTGGNKVGGFVGDMLVGTSISNSQAFGLGVAGAENEVGGFVGTMSGTSQITNSQASADVLGDNEVGGFVGSMFTDSKIISSQASGNIIDGMVFVGGFAGAMKSRSIIRNSSTTANVTGNSDVGGFVGQTDTLGFGGTIIERSSATGKVAADAGSTNIGGFIGSTNGGDDVIRDSYATGDVGGFALVGGFAGIVRANATIENSYSVGNVTGTGLTGGFIGVTGNETGDAILISLHWDIDTSGQANGCGFGDCTGVEGNTTVEMHQQATYVGWDFVNIWDIIEGVTYPFLR